MMEAWILSLAIAFLSGLWYYLSRREFRRLAAKIPGNDRHPILGSIVLFRHVRTYEDVWRVFLPDLREFSDGIFKVWFGPMLFVILHKPELFEPVFNSPHALDKPQIIYGSLLFHSHKGAFTKNGNIWKELRRPLNKTFNKKSLLEYHDTFVNKTNDLLEFLRKNNNGEEFDIHTSIGCLKLDILADTHFGIEMNEIEENRFDYLHHLSTIIDLAVRRTVSIHLISGPLYYLTSSWRKMKISLKSTFKLYEYILKKRMKHITGNLEDDNRYYTDALIKRNQTLNRTMFNMCEELSELVLAGTDTSTVVSSSALVFMAMFPEIQEAAYQEQLSIFGDSSRDPTPEDVSSMVYLSRVIKETLRHVAAPAYWRGVTNTMTIGDYEVPKGTILLLAIDHVLNDPKYWRNPSGFDPDHFLPEQEAERPRYAYPPFSFGPRGCPGFQYAMITLKVLLSAILRNYKLSTSLKFEDRSYHYFLLKDMKSGWYVKLEDRPKTNPLPS